MDISAWKTDDKRWVKERKAQWRILKKKLLQLTGIEGGYPIKSLEKYFLTGKFELSGVENPIMGNVFNGGVFIEFWLHPDHSEENFDRIIENYKQACLEENVSFLGRQIGQWRYFLSMMGGGSYTELAFPDRYQFDLEEGSFFDNLEYLVYEKLVPHRFTKDHYSNLNQKEFSEAAKHEFYLTLAGLKVVIFAEGRLIPFSLSFKRVPYFHDTLHCGYYRVKGFDMFVKVVDMIIDSPDEFDPLQVKMAKEIADVFEDPELPEELRDDLVLIRSGGKYRPDTVWTDQNYKDSHLKRP
ncbi:hypothetical protein [Saccharobesus litoralis]|nr:hypothetical protein [Saccharobesus litoralis]